MTAERDLVRPPVKAPETAGAVHAQKPAYPKLSKLVTLDSTKLR